ncbi:hypothetical protein ACIBQ1_19375 [Nonomuraea sp. NPDC050153]|uniref:hypothetical protein n=1 Tax=Nonomuraea sp. NPDC050153 TaxID=3364359 RepID=UPI00379C129E
MSGPSQGVIGALAALVLVAGCGSEARPVAMASPAAGRYQEAVLSAEELAAKVGCKPAMRTKAAELREGVCRTADGNYVVTSFTTEQGRRDWLDYAQMYGGSHLVGRRWVVSAAPAVLETLRKTLGGELQIGSSATPSGA